MIWISQEGIYDRKIAHKMAYSVLTTNSKTLKILQGATGSFASTSGLSLPDLGAMNAITGTEYNASTPASNSSGIVVILFAYSSTDIIRRKKVIMSAFS